MVSTPRPAPSHMIKAILAGVPHRSGQGLLRCISNSFPYFDDDAKRTTVMLLCATINAVRLHRRPDASLITSISRSGALLQNMFADVRHSKLAVAQGQDVLGIMQLLNCFLDKVQESDFPYIRLFLETCGRAGLFDFLHRIMEPGFVRDYIYGEPNPFGPWNMTFFLDSTSNAILPEFCRTFVIRLVDSVKQNPSLISALAPQLPHPRLLHNFVKIGQLLHRNSESNELVSPSNGTTREVPAWYAYIELERICGISGVCARSGCSRRRRKVCKDCYTTCYCSKACQR